MTFGHLLRRNGQNGWCEYEAGMKQLDDNIGAVMEHLRQRGLDGNTIVVFTTDNGAENFTWPDGTAITEGTANFLVNRRMNKSQQMHWTRRGADLLLQVRCAVYNGTFGSSFGQRFAPANDTQPRTVTAA